MNPTPARAPHVAPHSAVRVDIQVLRAVAVLSVIAAHFWPNRFPGGFAGVDVFFVVSGFLITSLMVNEIARTGRLSLIGFWSRRIRRIMPAALTVIAVVAVSVVWIGSPDQVGVLSRHVIASSLSAENLLLAQDSVDYDHRDDTTSALQHFWSLAVEEQFYLVWPLVVAGVLFLIGRNRGSATAVKRTLGVTVLAITVASFVYAVSLDHSNPATYFDPFARAWELGVGAAIGAVGVTRVFESHPWARRISAGLAWFTIIATVFVPGLSDLTPGFGVLPAVLATGLLIALAMPVTAVRAPAQFAITALSWIGDRSYSMYLWHWPALILVPYALGSELATVDKLIVILGVFLLSDLSYRFIEQPFRRSRSPVVTRPRFLIPIAVTATAAVIIGTVSLVGVAESRLNPSPDDFVIPDSVNIDPTNANQKYPLVTPFCEGAGAAVFTCAPTTEVIYGAKTFPYFPPESPTCRTSNKNDYFDCVLGATESTRSIAVIGDSHAKAMWIAFDDLGKRVDAAMHTYFLNGCAYAIAPSDGCTERNNVVRERILAGDFEFVIFVQAVDHRGRIDATDAYDRFAGPYQELRDAGVKFVVVKDNPGLTPMETQCQERHFRNPAKCAVSREQGFSYRDFAFDVATDLGIPTIDFSEIYCDDDRCPLAIGGVRVYRDYRHITTVFGKSLTPFLYNELVGVGLLENPSSSD